MALFKTCVGVIFSSLWTLGASAIVNGIDPGEDPTYDAVAGFSKTIWIDGTIYEHNMFGSATLIEPGKVILAGHLLPSTYGPNKQPDPGQFSVRFRRRVDGGIGTQNDGWESYHQVKINSFIFPEREISGDIVIGILESDVTHITPIVYDPAFTVDLNTPVVVAGWGFENYSISIRGGRLQYFSSLVNQIQDECTKDSKRSLRHRS